MFLTEISVRRPVATAMFFLAVVILGVISLTRLPVDLLPDIAYPKLTIWTTYPDVPPIEVEELVTVPIEEAVSTLARVRRVHSVSKEGVSLVTLEFLWGTDMDIAALNVREKLDNLRWVLPREAGRPTILRLDPRTLPVMTLAVTGDDLVSLKELTRNVIKRRLEQIQGVALATITGGLEREIQVEVDHRKLTSLGITIEQVASALASANKNLPGGTIKKGRYRYALRTLGEFQKVEEIAEVVVARNGNGTVIPLKDVATVVDGFKERESITRFNGQEAIGVVITKEAGSNTVEVSRRVQEVLQQLRQEYPDIQIHIASDQAKFISEAISNVLQAVILGGILAFLVLFLFLQEVRHPVNIGLVIPIAILGTFALMYFSGVSLNMISLGGLALGVGMLVDNSIVVLENIFRHRQEGADRFKAAVEGTREVAMPVTASTLTTISVFFPIIYVRGVAGQLFRDQSLTVTFALLASLLVALTLLPMLAYRFAPRKPVSPESGKEAETDGLFEPWLEKKKKPASKFLLRVRRVVLLPWQWLGKFIRWLWTWIRALAAYWFTIFASLLQKLTRPVFQGFNRAYERFYQRYELLLQWSLDHRGKVLLFAGLALVFSLLLGLTLDRQLMPRVDQRQFTLEVTLPPGSSLEATSETVAQMERLILQQPETASVFSHLGLAVNQTTLLSQESALNRAQILVRLKKEGRSTGDFMAFLRGKLQSLPEVEITLKSSGTLLTQFLGTTEADVAVKIRGNDLATSKELSQQIWQKIQDVPGLTDLHSSYQEGRPEIRISIDREAAGRLGLTARQVAEFVRNQMYGAVSTRFKEFDRKIDILVRPRVEARNDLDDLLNSYIYVETHRVPVRQLIHTRFTQGPTEIHRENQVRQVTLYGNIQGRGFREVIEDIEARLTEIERPVDYQIIVGGPREEMQRSFRSLLLAFALAAVLVYMILAGQFESLVHPFVISFAVPLAAIGVVLALFVTGQSFNVMSLIGVVVLVGIVVNDAIIKVDFINQERRRGTPLREAILQAGRKRLRPILMTTVTTVLGLLPMALGLGAGAELRRPLAVTVIGGLLSATFLTLLVVPVIYSIFAGLQRGGKPARSSRPGRFDL